MSRQTRPDAAYTASTSATEGRPPRVLFLSAPERIYPEDELMLLWRVDGASHVQLHVAGALEASEWVAHTGRLTLLAKAPGLVYCELRCFGAQDRARSGPDVVKSVVTEVLAPPVILQLWRHTLVGRPGDRVLLQYYAKGAERVLISRRCDSRPLEGPPIGVAEIIMGDKPERLVIEAIDYHGQRCQRQFCRLRPLRIRSDGPNRDDSNESD